MLTPTSSPNPSQAVRFHANASYLVIKNNRQSQSDLERAAEILAHAVQYLVDEQLLGRRDPVQANRQAVAILCQAGRELEQNERRAPARRSVATWLRGAALLRALD
jgi:hypothetical protein